MRKILFTAGLAVSLAFAGNVLAGDFNENASDTAVLIQNIYGNTTNPRPSGNGVLPSLAPGPWKCENPGNCFEGAVAGGSIGEFLSIFTGNGNADFANDDERETGTRNFSEPYEHPGLP